jgi:hypothetical protein
MCRSRMCQLRMQSLARDLTNATGTLFIDKRYGIQRRPAIGVRMKDYPPTRVACHRHISSDRPQQYPVRVLNDFELMGDAR